jgi:AcrR family transcriptional regulator
MTVPPPSHTPTRSDGALARRRLLEAALQLFADKGYQKTSTREIADAAGVNLGSISYYFGDKPGLYRAVFCESFCDATAAPDILQARDCLPDPATSRLDPDAALAAFFLNFLHPQAGRTDPPGDAPALPRTGGTQRGDGQRDG